MGRKATGQWWPNADGTRSARVRIRGLRPTFTINVASDVEAEDRAELLAVIAHGLARAPQGITTEEIVDKMLPLIASASASELPQRRIGIEAIIGGVPRASSGPVPTFKDFAEEWTSGRLHAKFPDRVKKKKSSDDDESRLRLYINPKLGAKRLTAITLDDLDAVMSDLPSWMTQANRRQIAQLMGRVMNLASYPAKYIEKSPVPRGFLPSKGAPKAKECLYPDEDLALVACSKTKDGKAGIPLLRRLAYGLLTREGFRGASELATLKWKHVDLERGRVRLDHHKTEHHSAPRSWALSATRGTWQALAVWKESFCASATEEDYVLQENGVPFDAQGLAETLRDDLKLAGIERSELFESNERRLNIRAHDLRSTFVVCSLANGWTEAQITDRTGHTTSGQLRGYDRAARAWVELNGGDLAPLHDAIPELRAAAIGQRLDNERFGRRDSNPDKRNQNPLSCH